MKKFYLIFVILAITISHFSCQNLDKKKVDQKAEQKPEEELTLAPPPDPSPSIIKKPKVIFPSSAKGIVDKGKVFVLVWVSIDGKVYKTEVLKSSHKVFEAIAESLAYHYEFETPTFEGKPHPVMFPIPIIFDSDSTHVKL